MESFARFRNKFFSYAIRIAIIVLVVALLYKEFHHIDMRELAGLLRKLGPWEQTKLVAIGLFAFTLISSYDFTMAKYFKLPLKNREIFKIAWISAAFNNLIGLGGISGGTVRAKLYQDAGVDRETTLHISIGIWAANTLGLALLLLVFSPYLINFKYFKLALFFGLYVPFFMFGQYLPKVRDMAFLRNIFSVKDFRYRLALLVASTFEWFGAALFFAYLLRIYTPEISYPVAVCTYIVATVVGVISFLPGGLGSFEVMCVIILKHYGFETTGLAASILLYRVIYYIIPWLLGMISIVWGEVKNRIKINTEQTITISQELIVRGMYYLCLLVGLSFLLFAVEPIRLTDYDPDMEFYVKSLNFWVHSIYFFIGVFLLAFSRGIKHRLKSAWWVMFGLLILGTLLILPSELNFKGILTYGVIILLMYFSKDCFQRESIPYQHRNFFIWFALLMAMPFLAALLSFIIHNRLFKGHHFMVIVSRFITEYSYFVIGYIIMALITSYLVGWFVSRRIPFHPATPQEVQDYFALVNTYGGHEFSHLANLSDKRIFFNGKKTVAFLYRPYKTQVLALGDPIGNPEDFEDAIDEFVEFTSDYNMGLTFYEVSGKCLELYASEGYSFMKIGEEAIVDLENFTLSGKRNKGLRNILNRMESGEYEFKIHEPPYKAEFLRSIKEVSDEWLGKRPEKQFSIGYFDVQYLQKSPIVTVSVEGRIEGFANIMPFYDGKSMSIDLMRCRPNGTNAVMDVLFLGLILKAQEDGFKEFNLGMAPLSNVGRKRYSKRKEKLMRYAFEFGNQIYGFRGLRNYKEKFRPRWENRYIAYRSESSMPFVLFGLMKTINRRDK